MVKDRHTYHIGDILYEVDPFNREIVKHTVADIHKCDNECNEVYKYETK